MREGACEEDLTGTYYRAVGEPNWTMLDPEGVEEVARIEEAVAQAKAAREAERAAAVPRIAGEAETPLLRELQSDKPKRRKRPA